MPLAPPVTIRFDPVISDFLSLMNVNRSRHAAASAAQCTVVVVGIQQHTIAGPGQREAAGTERERSMFEQLAELVNGDEDLVRRGRWLTTAMLVSVGEEDYLVRIEGGRVAAVAVGPFVTPSYDFGLAAARSEWELHWQPLPPPGSHDLFALLRRGVLATSGNLHPFMSNLRYFKEMLAKPRVLAAPR